MGFRTEFDSTSGTLTVYRDQIVSNVTAVISDLLELAVDPHVMPRPAQLDELSRLASSDRRRQSRLERARFGWHDGPRRPCYRRTRLR